MSLAATLLLMTYGTKQPKLIDGVLALMLVVANFANTKLCKKPGQLIETLAYGYSYKITQQGVSNDYQYDRV